ncbi:MAG: hypothetical protein AUJ92_01455 [Armatimonadetes bacterium CG2_30_59_28]|nr:type II toxin-antitoxin system HicA family toxin [Armatimonadota bacterium]OIO98415.1 MAG: hypothetical protein AUJ92_01455 [Armatimonadetes bacterium CG2_30_59_28]PIU62068.1 MAG: hypothetical protein COS85_19645 [Armatimonadetes bacterium CG07_land_8_20_14_0_80_59_28]PIX39413.1 MAG: hypothetical protein COZ56_17685 [Armatimonadetes bacterium CG_4_8_14_3_um_filter_58_9]PIZ48045.1 MAG: hypothetical protein COY42_07205 [Armatimonadetes bacterium CG_4_10_14_0_8_um_filter_66_14]
MDADIVLCYPVRVNAKQRKILRTIFAAPPTGSIGWSDIESLFRTLGAQMKEGQGSRVRVHLNGVRWVFHRPHPDTQAGKGRIRDVRTFLQRAGITDAEV